MRQAHRLVSLEPNLVRQKHKQVSLEPNNDNNECKCGQILGVNCSFTQAQSGVSFADSYKVLIR